MKIEYTPTHHPREHNAFEINLARKDTVTVLQRHYALYDIL